MRGPWRPAHLLPAVGHDRDRRHHRHLLLPRPLSGGRRRGTLVAGRTSLRGRARPRRRVRARLRRDCAPGRSTLDALIVRGEGEGAATSPLPGTLEHVGRRPTGLPVAGKNSVRRHSQTRSATTTSGTRPLKSRRWCGRIPRSATSSGRATLQVVCGLHREAGYEPPLIAETLDTDEDMTSSSRPSAPTSTSSRALRREPATLVERIIDREPESWSGPPNSSSTRNPRPRHAALRGVDPGCEQRSRRPETVAQRIRDVLRGRLRTPRAAAIGNAWCRIHGSVDPGSSGIAAGPHVLAHLRATSEREVSSRPPSAASRSTGSRNTPRMAATARPRWSSAMPGRLSTPTRRRSRGSTLRWPQQAHEAG